MKYGGVLPDILSLPGLLCDERLWAAQTEALAGLARSRVSGLTVYGSIAAMADAVLSRAPGRFAVCTYNAGSRQAVNVFKFDGKFYRYSQTIERENARQVGLETIS